MTSPTPAHPVAPPRALHWSVGAPLGAVAGVSAAAAGLVADSPALGLLGALVAAVPAVLAGRRVPALHRQVAECSSRAEVARAAAELAAERAGAALAAAERVVAERLAEIAAAENEASRIRPFVAETVALAADADTEVTEPVAVPVDLVRRTPRHRSSAPSAADVVVDLVKHTVGPAPVPAVSPVTVPVMMAPVAARASAPAARTMAFAADATRSEARPDADGQPDGEGREQAEGDARVDTAELQRIWDLGEAPRSRSGRGRRARLGAEVDALPDRPAHVAGMRRRARHRR